MPGWYHGGTPGLRAGDRLLPVSVTGAPAHYERYPPALRSALKLMMANYDPTLTYFSGSVEQGRRVAAGWGSVYQIEPDEPVVPDLDSPGGGASRSATITRVVQRAVPASPGYQGETVTGAELRQVLGRRDADAQAGGYARLWRELAAPLLAFAAAHDDDDPVDLGAVGVILAGIADQMELARTFVQGAVTSGCLPAASMRVRLGAGFPPG